MSSGQCFWRSGSRRSGAARSLLRRSIALRDTAAGAVAGVLERALGVMPALVAQVGELVAQQRAAAVAGNRVEVIHGERSDTERGDAEDHGNSSR